MNKRMQVVHFLSQFFMAHYFTGSGTLAKILARLLLPTPKGTVCINTRFGFEIFVNPLVDKGLERSIYDYGTYEIGTLHVLSKCLRKGDTFIDVGSNIGFISLFASQCVGEKGKVYSFEPHPEMFRILSKNKQVNGESNIFVYNMALGSTGNLAILYHYLDGNRGTASLVQGYRKDVEGIEVIVGTLDEFITKNAVPRIRMLKIDVEGWELEVLKGACNLLNSSNAPIICIEYSNENPIQNGKATDIYEFILGINAYEIYKLQRWKEKVSRLVKIADVSDLPEHNNLFCFLPNHLNDLPKSIFANAISPNSKMAADTLRS